jgi:signal transduction histidine kinase
MLLAIVGALALVGCVFAGWGLLVTTHDMMVDATLPARLNVIETSPRRDRMLIVESVDGAAGHASDRVARHVGVAILDSRPDNTTLEQISALDFAKRWTALSNSGLTQWHTLQLYVDGRAVFRRAQMFVFTSAIVLGVVISGARRWHRSKIEALRAEIAADLHDGLGTAFSKIAILSESTASEFRRGLVTEPRALTTIAEIARDGLRDMDDAVWFIDPRCDMVRRLIVRIRTGAAALFEGTPTQCTVDVADELLVARMAPEHRRQLYLFVKEALANVRRHAGATTVTVQFLAERDRVLLEIVDDGTGFPYREDAAFSQGRGIRNLKRRAEVLSGHVSIESAPTFSGTRIRLDVPRRIMLDASPSANDD